MMFSASSAAAWSGSSRCIGLKAICSARLSSADRLTMVEAGHDRHVEFEALRHHEDGHELAQRREPAQPQDRVQPDAPLGMAKLGSSRDFGHGSQISRVACRSQMTGSEAAEVALFDVMAQ